ncbi:MAG: cytochrome c [Gammaproteobacteria bacterium]|nr:cytochrome c [Gammaproteobacteria bacterium]
MNSWSVVALALLLTLGTGCDRDPGTAKSITTLSGPDIIRTQDPAQLVRGEQLFHQHCLRCHGERAQGAANWRQVDAEGKYPPPPLDGSGHAWHHTRQTLRDMIRSGSPLDAAGRPQGNMPAWQGTLSAAEIDDVIAWFQSLWPDEIYAAWYERVEGGGLN